MSVVAPTSSSFVWRSIIKAKEDLKEGFTMSLKSGFTSLWYSDWISLGKLCNVVPFVHISDTNLVVSDLCPEGAIRPARATTGFSVAFGVVTMMAFGVGKNVRESQALFLSTLWWSWKWRNNWVFDPHPWSVGFLIRQILLMKYDLIHFVHDSEVDILSKLCWRPPPAGFYKLNLDGSFNPFVGLMGTGGVLCNSSDWFGACLGNRSQEYSLRDRLTRVDPPAAEYPGSV
ncbi:putative ribonuclease H protein [Sesbania bispinosa]|nr:putative ribonuclease H protein [Sesbania bispinosa]